VLPVPPAQPEQETEPAPSNAGVPAGFTEPRGALDQASGASADAYDLAPIELPEARPLFASVRSDPTEVSYRHWDKVPGARTNVVGNGGSPAMEVIIGFVVAVVALVIGFALMGVCPLLGCSILMFFFAPLLEVFRRSKTRSSVTESAVSTTDNSHRHPCPKCGFSYKWNGTAPLTGGTPPVPTIIRNTPFFDGWTELTVRGQHVPIKPYQIIVWVSISQIGRRELDPITPRFPAVLDTGFNHSFVIHRQQLAQWAGLQPQQFQVLGPITVYGEESPLLAGNVWLHPNEPGKRDIFSDQPPFCVQLDNGFAVACNRSNAPPTSAAGTPGPSLVQSSLVD
jgi:hypothetical protein